MPKPTLRHIADELGLSVTTVSRALNDHPDTSDETKLRVLEKVKAVGYVSNTLARDLRTRRTSTIGVVISDNANPYFAPTVRGIQDAANAGGYQVILCNTDEEYAKELKSIQLLLEMRVAGIAITPVQTQRQDILDLINSEVPFVLMSRHFADLNTNYVVGADNVGGCLATSHLIERGLRQIWYINGPADISPAQDRLTGYRQALHEHGLNYDERLVVHGNVDPNGGYRAAKEIMAAARPPIGIFCFSDYVATGAIQAILEAGLAIPDDVALVGYDNIEFAAHLRVPLTTINNPRYQLGTRAFEVLKENIQNGAQSSMGHIVLEPRLVVRSSA